MRFEDYRWLDAFPFLPDNSSRNRGVTKVELRLQSRDASGMAEAGSGSATNVAVLAISEAKVHRNGASCSPYGFSLSRVLSRGNTRLCHNSADPTGNPVTRGTAMSLSR